MPRFAMSLGLAWFLAASFSARDAACADANVANPSSATVVSLDGNDWLLATDPKNAGRNESWFRGPRPEAKQTKVPWIIQDAFPGYHGLAWYWRQFTAPTNPWTEGRFVLRFGAVDYKADVWLNDVYLGSHEGGESEFSFDVTKALKPGQPNRLAVRVLNPTHDAIDGIKLNETAHRNKVMPYSAGSAWNLGGITESVEILVVPVARVSDVFARPDWKTGVIRIQATVCNAASRNVEGQLEFSVAPAARGETLAVTRLARALPPGESVIETQIAVPNHRLWQLNEPNLYRVTSRVVTDRPQGVNEHSLRCGFRDFRFENGAFRLNGKRIYLRGSHTGNCTPVGLEQPHDPDVLRRDLINAKMMRLNMVRFISGVPKRYQLDLCDEIGLMVYDECYAGWCMGDSPQFAPRYAESTLGMVLRDRNHACVTLWGLLNETQDGPVFRHAVGFLPTLRKFDDTRVVLLNSGRFDNATVGVDLWSNESRTDPCVNHNGTSQVIEALGIKWTPGRLVFHPGEKGEYAVVRWTAPENGQANVAAAFSNASPTATTDIHVLHNDRALFDGFINLNNAGPESKYRGTVQLQKGDRIDCVVGYGNKSHGADSTGLEFVVAIAGKTYDAAKAFTLDANPNGPWTYGEFSPAERPRPDSFAAFRKNSKGTVGSVSNPGTVTWQNVLGDIHPYQPVPHTAAVLNTLRTIAGNGQPTFLSEYGVGSAVDLVHVSRHFEQIGKTEVEDAQFYRGWRDQFLADYQRYRMDEAFARPRDFFTQDIAHMAYQRFLGISAIRANPKIIGHSITGLADQGMTGEGMWTAFRELKPGATDAIFDAFAPLLWCTFVDPVNVYRNKPARFEAVLANEDVLKPGKYPVRVLVVGPNGKPVFEKRLEVAIPARTKDFEPPMVLAVFDEKVAIDGPSGKYRFVVEFEKGAAAAGGVTEFYVGDPADMPAVATEVVLLGDDAGLVEWLDKAGVKHRPFDGKSPQTARETILVVGSGPLKDAETVYPQLAERMARGSTAIFLTQEPLARGNAPTGWLPLARKGGYGFIMNWLYHKQEWCKAHPVFEGMPSPGVMDYVYYRDLIHSHSFFVETPPDNTIAGAINAAAGYNSGVVIGTYRFNAGQFLINAMRLRAELGATPPAERMFRNMIRWAAADAAKPLAPLPADFKDQLKAIGYSR
jgi:hypothetical protein